MTTKNALDKIDVIEADKEMKDKRKQTTKPADARAIVELCAAAALDKKALNLTVLSIGNVTGYADYLMLVSATSTRQASAIANNVHGILKKSGVKALSTNGISEGQWALLDFGSVIVHVFHQPVREYYDLESIWTDAPYLELDPVKLARLIPEKSTTKNQGYTYES